METTVLEMFFNDAYGKQVSLSVKDPRPDLVPTDVETAMTTIAALDCFDVDGPLTLKGAQVVVRNVTEMDFE